MVNVHEMVSVLGGELLGDGQIKIDGIAPLVSATASQISFLSNPKYAGQLAASQAGCVIVAQSMREAVAARQAAIVTPDPYSYFARLTQWWKKTQMKELFPNDPSAGGGFIHPSSVVDVQAEVDASAYIGPLCVIEKGAKIGARTHLKSRVTVSEGCEIGSDCMIHSGVVIGSDGFGFAPSGKIWEKIEQLGRVRIGNQVEIGANTTIDRGALDDTVIGNGVKIDNLVQIAHNVTMGNNTLVAAQAGISGSAHIGNNCFIGGAAGIAGHIDISDGVFVSPYSPITKSLSKPVLYSGVIPSEENGEWRRVVANLKLLGSLRERVKKLEQLLKKEAE